jgi:hypothetical protein
VLTSIDAMVGNLGLAAIWGFGAGRSEAAENQTRRRRDADGFAPLRSGGGTPAARGESSTRPRSSGAWPMAL